MLKNFTLYVIIQISIIILLLVTLSSVKINSFRIWTYLNPNVISEGGQAKLMFTDLNNFTPNDSSIFVIGSSHAYRGYDPRIFDKFGLKLFNMGTSGQNMKDSYALLKANKEKIKRLILDIYPGVLQDITEESTLILIQNSNSNQTAFRVLKNNITINSINNISARLFDVNPRSFPYNEKYIYNGYVQKDHDFISDTNLVYESFNPGSNFLYLDSILNYAVQNKINTSIASHPLKWNSNYLKFYTTSYLPQVNRVLTKYPQIQFYDYTVDHPNNDSLFSDGNHLNQKGVNWYNNQLLNKLNSNNTIL
jgi:hypothetical protein